MSDGPIDGWVLHPNGIQRLSRGSGCSGRAVWMSRAVLFVHGTRVRAESYASSFAQIRQALPRAVRLSGCFWGQSHGAAYLGRCVGAWLRPDWRRG